MLLRAEGIGDRRSRFESVSQTAEIGIIGLRIVGWFRVNVLLLATRKAGTQLICTGAWDNSPQNPENPDPTATVTFGEQTFNEMFIGYFNYAQVP